MVRSYRTTCLSLPAAWLARIAVGERLTLTEARDAKRSWIAVEAGADGCWEEADKTAYLTSEIILFHHFNADKVVFLRLK